MAQSYFCLLMLLLLTVAFLSKHRAKATPFLVIHHCVYQNFSILVMVFN